MIALKGTDNHEHRLQIMRDADNFFINVRNKRPFLDSIKSLIQTQDINNKKTMLSLSFKIKIQIFFWILFKWSFLTIHISSIKVFISFIKLSKLIGGHPNIHKRPHINIRTLIF